MDDLIENFTPIRNMWIVKPTFGGCKRYDKMSIPVYFGGGHKTTKTKYTKN